MPEKEDVIALLFQLATQSIVNASRPRLVVVYERVEYKKTFIFSSSWLVFVHGYSEHSNLDSLY